VSATNRDLLREIERGAFRQDLYYRIGGYVFQTPPLRERRQDILPLARHFLRKLLGREPPSFDMHVRDYLLNRAYPGNVRDLHQLMQRISARYSNSGPITVGDLPEEDRPVSGLFVRAWPNERFEKSIGEAVMLRTNLKQISQATAQTAMRFAIELERGNIKRAAARLGVTDRAIQMRRATGQLGCREEDDLRASGPGDFEPPSEGSLNPLAASPVAAGPGGAGQYYGSSTPKLAAALRQ
jgi:DNA-binding NtrC family response regulator